MHALQQQQPDPLQLRKTAVKGISSLLSFSTASPCSRIEHQLLHAQVQGKVNAITIDSCSRTGLVFQDLVSSCEVVNCSSVEVQSTGIMPTIAIDKTDGILVLID